MARKRRRVNDDSGDPENQEKQLICDFFERRPSGFFVEVGAFHPYFGSQTWLLEQQGWRGILVEPVPRHCEELRAKRPHSQVFQLACGAPGHPATMEFHEAESAAHSTLRPDRMDAETRYVATHQVPVLTLDEVLAQAGNPRIDFISVDVEGFQFEVLSGFSVGQHHPELLVVEDHLRNRKTHRLMTRQAYRLVRRTDANNWYVPVDHPYRPTVREALRLWRKVWPGTPLRRLKFELQWWWRRRR